MFKKIDPKMNLPKMEEAILELWDREKIFEKSVEKVAPEGDFVFYEGPPTANGKPGLHHVLARSFKDIIPRYKTMKGYRVQRKAGWDTHGLPVELQVEKALGLRSKQEIENIVPGDARASVIEFNKKCKESVWEYRELWEKMTRRMGYWVDMAHPYITYENSYIESVWWQLAQIAKLKNAKGESFLYKGHKVVPYCYRCGTALSSHEVAQGYKETTDNSVYVKFRVTSLIFGDGSDMDCGDNTYILAWTTTPWTLPGNVALAIHPDLTYASVEHRNGDRYIILADKVSEFFSEESILRKNFLYDGKELLKGSIRYKSIFETAGEDSEKAYRVVAGKFVTTDSGTGIVHIAPAFGEDDANVARENDLPTLLTVGQDGNMDEGFPGAGIPVKKMNDKNRYAVDDLIIENLKERELLFKEEPCVHEYPFCWRCDTPLIYYAKPSWFIRMSELRKELVKGNEAINWVPDHIRDGRFGEWLSNVKDWAISRERYWGTPLPIWECWGENGMQINLTCNNVKLVESIDELEKLSGKKLEDVHKPYIDAVTFPCEKCGGIMERVPEVLDVWFDSGAMPLAQFGFPFSAVEKDKENIEKRNFFPADYICEAIDQTRGWFYTLHAVANLLAKAGIVSEKRAYKNAICLGHILDAKGKKMSKSKGNVIDPFEIFDQYGADALRWMLFSINQLGLPKRFDVKGMRDVQNRVFRMLWNSYSFFVMYASIDEWQASEVSKVSENMYDRWILAELQELIKGVTKDLDDYDVYGSTKKIEAFIDNVSNWYIRENRSRFWKNENDNDKECAYETLYKILKDLSLLMAPFTPFISESIYRNLTDESSVHLANWPTVDTCFDNDQTSGLIEHMRMTRESVNVGLRLRAMAKRNLRQPLETLILPSWSNLDSDWIAIIQKALNVKAVKNDNGILNDEEYITDKTSKGEIVALKITLTPELRLEGEAREIIRAIQEGRKKAGFNVEDRIALGYSGKEKVFEMFGDMIAHEVLATEVVFGNIAEAEYKEETNIEGESFIFQLKRV